MYNLSNYANNKIRIHKKEINMKSTNKSHSKVKNYSKTSAKSKSNTSAKSKSSASAKSDSETTAKSDMKSKNCGGRCGKGKNC